ncbi:hypothetical protein J2X90_002369 [Variovorax paradoxus]|uniref:hypothetical protein n=1 Tax=Variovorax paradoxus TaxID=34073 RepID=UPI00278A85F3|nr:hypothetical protein [Variovorax paradoxus]MDQ0024571.1 hypothetical protein [Variovorax paradoxus]
MRLFALALNCLGFESGHRLSALLALLLISPLADASGENCDLSAPPKTAAVDAVHGYFIFIHPRKIASNYTGCQMIWGERGEVFMTIKYEKGAPYTFTQFNPENGKLVLDCRYRDKVLKRGGGECPAYQRITGDTAKGFSQEEEALLLPSLAPERDPRRDTAR